MAKKNGYCYPTNIYLARLTKYSCHSVQKSIDKLTDNGLIDKEFIYDENGLVCGRKIFIK